MCGIVGFVDNINELVSNSLKKETTIENMMNTIIHRGPDSDGKYIDEDVALGFRRLSIIDLAHGDQPIFNEDESMVIIFNGEIYNYQSIKEDLISKGHIFKTSSDTEVLIHCYEEYQEKMLDKLRGMFAFVIWDKKSKRLFGARDYFGIKPFYYAKMNNTFMFGSEIKSFLEHPNFIKKVNKKALKPYLSFQYSVLEETFFADVFKLLPGHYFIYENGTLTINKYFEYKFNNTNESLDTYVEQIKQVMDDSVKVHEIGEVKVGAFLSGGVDSSYITSLMRPDKTFSVGFEDVKFNESGLAKELSDILKIDNYSKIIDPNDCFDLFGKMQYLMDEPQSNPSCVPLYFLAELARRHVTVVLSGEGSDELFAGYDNYRLTELALKYRKLPKLIRKTVKSMVEKLPYFKGQQLLIDGAKEIEDFYIGQASIFSEKEAKEILKASYQQAPTIKEITKPIFNQVKDYDEVTKMQYLDLHLWLPHDILLKADKMSMAHSIELRVPFLDKEVLNVASILPKDYKVNSIDTKYALRQAANSVIPEAWAKRKKVGFPVPIKLWLREEKYYKIVKEMFNKDFVAEFFNQDKLIKLLDDHYHNKANNQRKVWTIFTFLTWYEQYFILR